MKQISKLKEEAKKICNECGIPYKDVPVVSNNRLTKALGRYVIYNRWYYTEKKIELSKATLDDKTPWEFSVETLVHEYIHTCEGCQNHGSTFQSYCKKVMAKYPQYKMGTYVDKQQYEELKNLGVVKNKQRPYTAKCTECGAEWHRASLCPLIKTPERYRCGVCGGIIERVK